MDTEQQPTPVVERVDPIHGFAGRLGVVLDGLAGSPAWAMTPDEQAEALVELSVAQARLAELRLRVLAAADRNQVGVKERVKFSV